MTSSAPSQMPLPCVRCLGNLYAATNPEPDRFLDLDCQYRAGVACNRCEQLNRPCDDVVRPSYPIRRVLFV